MHVVRVMHDRAGLTEAVHPVRIAVHRDGESAFGGDGGAPVFLRSSAKPVQALACIVTGAADRFSMDDGEIALACGSHNGEDVHVAAAGALLRRIGLGPEDLLCGSHPPVHGPSARALVRAGTEPTALHNNCSGKHAAMLAACVAAGWPVTDYVDPGHPLQRMNLTHVSLYTGVPADEIVIGIDGCSAPVFGVPLTGAARLAATAWSPDEANLPGEIRAAAQRIRSAVRARPEMVAGTERSDTDLIAATGGRVLSKVGAEGLWCIGIAGRGAGLAVKAESGASDAARRAGLALLHAGGVLDADAWRHLAAHHDDVRRNHRGLDVGRVRIEIPEGVAEAMR